MPHDALREYLTQIETAVDGLTDTYIERYEEEILTSTRANLRIRIRFVSGTLLEINEALSVVKEELHHLDYRYHCQGQSTNLLFRYDSTPHFPGLPHFPEHKHTRSGTTGQVRPNLFDVFQEACSYNNFFDD